MLLLALVGAIALVWGSATALGLARSTTSSTQAAVKTGVVRVEVRVATLLDRRQRRDGPGKVALLSAVTILFAAVAASADAVHHGVEIVLGLLGG